MWNLEESQIEENQTKLNILIEFPIGRRLRSSLTHSPDNLGSESDNGKQLLVGK